MIKQPNKKKYRKSLWLNVHIHTPRNPTETKIGSDNIYAKDL